MKKMQPEQWLIKFIQSATNGREIKASLRRGIIVIWAVLLTILLIVSSLCTYQGVTSIPRYKKAKQLLALSQRLNHQSEEYHSIFGCLQRVNQSNTIEDTSTVDIKSGSFLSQFKVRPNHTKVESTFEQGHFDYQLWTELGVKNPSPYSCDLENLAYNIQVGEVSKIAALPLAVVAIFLFLLITWIGLKITFWIRDSE